MYNLLIFFLHSNVHLIFVPTGTLTDTRGTRQRKLFLNKTLLVTRIYLHRHRLSLSWNSIRAHCSWRIYCGVRCNINTLAHKIRLHQKTLWKDADLHILKDSESAASFWILLSESRILISFPDLIHNFALYTRTLMTAQTCTPCFCPPPPHPHPHFSQNVIISVWQFISKHQRIRAAQKPLHFQPQQCGIYQVALLHTGKKKYTSKLFGDFKSAGVEACWQEQPVDFATSVLLCSV